MPAISESLDWTAIVLGINSMLLTVVLILGGYIWRRAIKDLDEFSEHNRLEHEAFETRFGKIEQEISYMHGKSDAEEGRKRS